MATEKSMRCKDRALARKAQYLTYQNLSNFVPELYFKLFESIVHGINKEPIDVSNYTAAQLITAEYYINWSLFEPLLSGKSDLATI
jgi:hypothetical protein